MSLIRSIRRSFSLALTTSWLLLWATTLMSGVSAQKSPAPAWFDLAELSADCAKTGNAWMSALAVRSLSCGIYQLTVGAEDKQTPHGMDEMYHVTAGRATLHVGEEKRAVHAGSLVFVPAGVPHKFTDIEEDLTAFVLFSQHRAPTRGGMAGALPGPRPTEQTAYPEASERGNTRIFYWFGGDSAGQVSIDFGRPSWQEAYAKFLENAGGPRWRLGENFWTSLDTNIELELGGVTLPIGQHYLVLDHNKKRGLQLVALDPDESRKRRLDAYEAPKTTSGIEIPLGVRRAGQVPALDVELRVDQKKRDRGELIIRFGPYVLTATLLMRPQR